jgi:GTP-binding protein HflX
VLDRFNLILEIFSSRASSREAKLQVELARLSYDAPQVKNALALKKRGEQPGFRGAGAYEQSMYHDIRGRMAKIRAELKDVENMGEDRRQRRREQGFDLVALAGYTNAGKSTLLNALTGSAVEAKDQPFTTLSPTTRALEVMGRKVLLTDTVGFIDDLPHFLIKAFRSTLSEISEADLVLLVADMSEPLELLRRKLAASHKALWDCDVTSPIVTILNKADRLAEGEAAMKTDQIRDLAPYPVLASAFTGQGLGVLEECISQRLQPLQEYEICLPYTSQGLSELSRLYETAELLAVRYEEELIVRLRGRKETVARALSGVHRL